MPDDRQRPHVLLIDDTPEILDLIETLLAEEGYRVTTSLALLDIDTVKALAPDAIIQDLLFAGDQEQGWASLTTIRRDPALAHIPLVLCTAAPQTVTDEVMAEHLDRLGVRVILKPFNIDDLLTVLAATRTPQMQLDQATGAEGWGSFQTTMDRQGSRARPGGGGDGAGSSVGCR